MTGRDRSELTKWLEQDKSSGRFAAQAEALRRLVPAGSRDSAGNSVDTLVAALEAQS